MRRRRYPRFDKLNPSSESASYCKKQTSSKDTTPERLLRTALFRAGLRFRKNAKTIPGKPDVVFVRARVAVFIDGDFWHGKNWRKRRLRLSKGSNRGYWLTKIQANARRDRQVSRTLTKAGWVVLRFWESDIRTSFTDAICRKVLAAVKDGGSEISAAAAKLEFRTSVRRRLMASHLGCCRQTRRRSQQRPASS